jgi:hypothetical protein
MGSNGGNEVNNRTTVNFLDVLFMGTRKHVHAFIITGKYST